MKQYITKNREALLIYIALALGLILALVGYFMYKNISGQISAQDERVAKISDRLETADVRLEKNELLVATLQKDGYVEKPGLAPIASKILPSIVFILDPTNPTPYNESGNVIANTGSGVRGTGFFVSKNGFIATAKHVVNGLDENKITVKDSHNKLYVAKIVSTQSQSDIAVLKIEGINFSPVELGLFENIRVGDGIGLLGFNPGFNLPLVHSGNISAKGTDESGVRLFTINSFVNKGNSGSPVFSLATGRVVGVVSARKSEALNRPLIDVSKFSSGFSVGGIDPVKLSAEVYNETLKLVSEASQVGIGIIYSTDEIAKFR